MASAEEPQATAGATSPSLGNNVADVLVPESGDDLDSDSAVGGLSYASALSLLPFTTAYLSFLQRNQLNE